MSYFNPTPEEQEASIKRSLREWDHFSKQCYADKQSCISCSCDPINYYACPAHAGSQRYQNELMSRMLAVQEKIANK
jgi:hypothetical protein